MPTTADGYRYPASSAAPNAPQDIQNLATDVQTKTQLKVGAWAVLAAGAPSFDFAPPLNTWGDLTGITGSVTVPTGRTLECRFRVPSVTFTGIGYLQLLMDGVMKDLAKYQTTTGTVLVPGHLFAYVAGAGASIAVKVQGQLGSGTFNIRGESLMSPILEYRIV